MYNEALEFDSYNVGGNNKDGDKIVKILAREKGKYILYCCDGVEDLYFDGTEEASNRYNEISGNLAILNNIVFEDKKKYPFLIEQITYAIRESIKGDIENANDILNRLEQKIMLLKSTEGRVYYLLGALIPLILNVIVSTIFILIGYKVTNTLWKECIFIYYIITFGSLGGFLSISINVKKLDIDYNSGNKINFISGFLRIIIAMTGSMFIYFVIKSNMLLGLANQSNSKHVLLAFAIVSGFSETIIPNVISKLEKQADDKNRDKSSSHGA